MKGAQAMPQSLALPTRAAGPGPGGRAVCDTRPGRLALLMTLAVAAALLGGCGSMSRNGGGDAAAIKGKSGKASGMPRAGSGRGGYYLDDGPGDEIPEGLENTPDAIPRVEPYASRGNKPYAVFGTTYTPFLDDRPFKQRGRGSWYGKKFHAQRTSSGEPYDMFQMTAAHPTLPIPSYARVTNLANGKQVIVRVNDRGPFHSDRVIDLSYTAALKLGYLGTGSAELEVERLLPDEIARINSERNNGVLAAQAAPAPVNTAAARNVATAARMPAAAAPVTAAPADNSQWTGSQGGEGAQVEVMGALTPVVETTVLPAQPVPLAAAMPLSGSRETVRDISSVSSAASSSALSSTSSSMPGRPGAAAAEARQAPATPPAASATFSESAPPAATAATAVASGVYLQLGAFSQAANADAARTRLGQNWHANLPRPQVVQGGSLYRVYSGPYGSRQEADAAARQIEGSGGGKPVIVLR